MKQRNNRYLTVVFISPGRAFNGDNKSELGTAAGGELNNISSKFSTGGVLSTFSGPCPKNG